MAFLTEVEFLKKLLEITGESLKKANVDLPEEIRRLRAFIQGRIDSLPE